LPQLSPKPLKWRNLQRAVQSMLRSFLVMCSNSDDRSRTRRCHLCPPTSCMFPSRRLSKACPTARRPA
jgi:hypothetical protein